MAPTAVYDDIADWYENDFQGAPGRDPSPDPIGLFQGLEALLGSGTGPCLEVGCGTGSYAAWLRSRGWTPLGLDLSWGMLTYARPRLPVAQADAERLPIPSGSISTAVGVMVHTDMPTYPRVLDEVARVLSPGGIYVHLGVHPCFCGGFADRSDPEAVVIRPGYRDGHWTKASYTDKGVRDKVGATHFPLAQLLNSFVAAGLVLEQVLEGGGPTPIMLAARVRKNVPS